MYAKFTICYKMTERGGITATYTLGKALSMEAPGGKMVVSYDLLCEIIDLVLRAAELYEENTIQFVEIKVYYRKEGDSLVGKKIKSLEDEDEIFNIINRIVRGGVVSTPHPLNSPIPISNLRGRRNYASSFVTPDTKGEETLYSGRFRNYLN